MTCSIFIASTTASCWPWPHRVAVGDVDGDDGALDRRGARRPSRPVPSGQAHRPRPGGCAARSAFTCGVMREQRQRIAALHRARRRDPASRAGDAAAPPRSAAACSAAAPRATRCARRPSGCGRCRRRSRDAPGSLRRNAILVATPSSRNSLRAREARATASAKSGDGEWAMTLASSESNARSVR